MGRHQVLAGRHGEERVLCDPFSYKAAVRRATDAVSAVPARPGSVVLPASAGQQWDGCAEHSELRKVSQERVGAQLSLVTHEQGVQKGRAER